MLQITILCVVKTEWVYVDLIWIRLKLLWHLDLKEAFYYLRKIQSLLLLLWNTEFVNVAEWIFAGGLQPKWLVHQKCILSMGISEEPGQVVQDPTMNLSR